MKSVGQVLAFNVLSKILMGVLSVAMIRLMSVEEFAVLTFSLAFATVLGQVFSNSFNRIFIIGYRQLDLGASLRGFMAAQIFMVLAACVLLLPFAQMEARVALAAACFALSLALFEFSKTWYQQKQRFVRYSILEFSRAVLICLLVLGFSRGLSVQMTTVEVLGVYVVGMGLVFGLVLSEVWAGAGSRSAGVDGASKLILQVLRGPYRHLFGYCAVLSLFSQMDILMLWSFDYQRELSVYGSAFRYYGMLSMLLGAVHVVLLPAVQSAAKGADLVALFRGHRRIVFLFLPVVLLAVGLASHVMPWVDEGRYPDAVPVFYILCGSAVVSLAFSPHVNWLMRSHQFRFLFGLIVVATLLNMTLNAALIPLYGAMGVAVATTFSAAAVTVSTFIRSRRLICRIPADGDVDSFIEALPVSSGPGE